MGKILTTALAITVAATFPTLALDTQTRAPKSSADTTRSIRRIPLEHGQNSFTESQARARIENTGFTHVSSLWLDPDGIWRGTALKGSSSVEVGLDFKGNVTAAP